MGATISLLAKPDAGTGGAPELSRPDLVHITRYVGTLGVSAYHDHRQGDEVGLTPHSPGLKPRPAPSPVHRNKK